LLPKVLGVIRVKKKKKLPDPTDADTLHRVVIMAELLGVKASCIPQRFDLADDRIPSE